MEAISTSRRGLRYQDEGARKVHSAAIPPFACGLPKAGQGIGSELLALEIQRGPGWLAGVKNPQCLRSETPLTFEEVGRNSESDPSVPENRSTPLSAVPPSAPTGPSTFTALGRASFWRTTSASGPVSCCTFLRSSFWKSVLPAEIHL